MMELGGMMELGEHLAVEEERIQRFVAGLVTDSWADAAGLEPDRRPLVEAMSELLAESHDYFRRKSARGEEGHYDDQERSC